MSYDDPPEPTDEEILEHEVEKSVTKNRKIAITGLTAGDVEATILGILRGKWQLDQKIDESITTAVKEKVSKITDEVIRRRVETEVEVVIAEGFAHYDQWSGRPSGKTTTVRELIHKLVTEVRDEGYNNKGTLAERMIRKVVTELFDKELKATLEQLRLDFKKQADAVFKAKLVEALKDAVGLRA